MRKEKILDVAPINFKNILNNVEILENTKKIICICLNGVRLYKTPSKCMKVVIEDRTYRVRHERVYEVRLKRHKVVLGPIKGAMMWFMRQLKF